MRAGMTITAAAALAATLGGCFGRGTTTGGARVGGGATVLEHEVFAQARGSLLDAMIGRVPGLRVVPRPGCPSISLREPNTLPGLNDPLVYVDGTRTQDACVLTSLRAGDVERVEVYPTGVTNRPGYAAHSHGLILVFLLGA